MGYHDPQDLDHAEVEMTVGCMQCNGTTVDALVTYQKGSCYGYSQCEHCGADIEIEAPEPDLEELIRERSLGVDEEWELERL